MSAKKRNRARILTPEGLQKLQGCIRERELADNAGYRYSLEKLGELTGLDPGTVAKILDRDGSDKRSLNRCFQAFGLTLEEEDHISVAQVQAPQIDPKFVGREGAIADLRALVSRGVKIIAIQARGGVGKTTLARRYLQQEFDSVLEFPIAKETKDIASIESLLEEKLRQLEEEPGREFLVSLDRLKRKLQAEQIGILIDNLEPALDSVGKFIEPHRRYVELLRVLADPAVQSITLITSRERLRESSVTVQHYLLKSLDITAWEQFFQSRGLIPFVLNARGSKGEDALAALHNAYGGNAKAMEIISSAILEDFAGDAEAYWQVNQDDLLVERDLEDLVTQQLDRLQQLDLDAYKLLCRMGCYRYQDVPTIQIKGLFCLLWDMPENRHRRVIKSLTDRSLIEFENGKYWLHPVIRADAISRLRKRKYWEVTNRIAATFWEENIDVIKNINDLIMAFEAFYHYLEIGDCEQASSIILNKKKAESVGYKEIELGRSFYRLGLIKQLLLPILTVIENIESAYRLSSLHHLLGIAYRLTGQFHKALEHHSQAIKLGEESLKDLGNKTFEKILDFRILKVRSLFHIGLCKINLWELDSALNVFKEAFSISQEIKRIVPLNRGEEEFILRSYALDSFLLFLDSHINPFKKDIVNTIDKVCEGIRNTQIGTGHRMVFAGMAYKNAGEITKAIKVFDEIIEYSKRHDYLGSRAIALNCKGEIFRDQSKFDLAIENHTQAIFIFRQQEVLCDLANAHYQLGLTYQAAGNAQKSLENFQEATRLFREMDAPKQVARVQTSMKSEV